MTSPRHHRHTQTEYVVSQIRRRIGTGIYSYGAKLRQQAVADELHVSLTPVREAFVALTAEGLLERSPFKGVKVAQFTSEAVRDLYAVRRLLEGEATRLACERANDEGLKVLSDIYAEMGEAHRQGDDAHYQDLNERFHEAIYGMSGNRALALEIQTLWRRFPRDTFGLMPHRRHQSFREHEELLRAFRHRDAAWAAAAMNHHIAGSEYDILTFIEKGKDRALNADGTEE